MTDKTERPFYHSLSGNTEEDKILLKPVEYISQYVKTHFFTKLTSAFNYWLKISPDKIQQIDEIIHIVCSVYILYSDIQDNSTWRDNIPVAQSIYGFRGTINAANYVKLIAFEKIINLHPEAVKILNKYLLEFNKVQEIDMYWKYNFDFYPNEKDYESMAKRKITWMINLVVRLMKLFSTYEEDFSSLISLLGLYHNIYTDYCNFCKKLNDKNYRDDVTEGQFSFPIIHAVTRNPGNTQIINILKQKTDINMKHYCIKLLEKFGSFKYTREVLEKQSIKLKTEIERLGGNPILLIILNELETKMPNLHSIQDP